MVAGRVGTERDCPGPAGRVADLAVLADLIWAIGEIRQTVKPTDVQGVARLRRMQVHAAKLSRDLGL